mmetsp:Transcript_120893/g.235378  ORF Transcript_120893/g.235378 Transcript_120893/m.235378 type:complete len:178 (-) Transcript_120893:176-709(-)
MTLRQYVRRAGMPPASLSNFESLAIDAAAFPQHRRRNANKPTRVPKRISAHSDHAQEEPYLASVVLFDALALDSACCPRGRRRHAIHQGTKFNMAQQASTLRQSGEDVVPLSDVLSSFLLPVDCTKGIDQGSGSCCGSSDGTGDLGASHVHTPSNLSSSSNTEEGSSHDMSTEAEMW